MENLFDFNTKLVKCCHFILFLFIWEVALNNMYKAQGKNAHTATLVHISTKFAYPDGKGRKVL